MSINDRGGVLTAATAWRGTMGRADEATVETDAEWNMLTSTFPLALFGGIIAAIAVMTGFEPVAYIAAVMLFVFIALNAYAGVKS